MKNSKRKRYFKIITGMLCIIVFLVWGCMLFVKWKFWGVSGQEIYNEIASSLLGILPPMIVIEFLYAYLTKDHVADEMAEQITKTLMGNSDAINLFNQEDKIRFMKTTMSTVVSEDTSEMMYSLVEPYLSNTYNLRKSFEYSITVRDIKENKLFHPENYMKIEEILRYKKLFANDKSLPRDIHIGFFTKDSVIDEHMRNQTYILRENLMIRQQELDLLMSYSEAEKLAFVLNDLKLEVYIDDKACKIDQVTIDKGGIDIRLKSNYTKKKLEYSHGISFVYPQKRGHSYFMVYLSEPTYAPEISFSYPVETKTVEAFSFLCDGDDARITKAARHVAGYQFHIQDKWICPMSGIFFTIDEKINHMCQL